MTPVATRTALLSVDDVDFSYGSVQVLFGVTSHVERGRGARTPRDERRREVDDPPRDRRTRESPAGGDRSLDGET